MSMDAVLQVRMDAGLKRDAEALYARMGTSLAEAVRIFARQSVAENALPFSVRVPAPTSPRTLGLADGEYSIPENIDVDNGVVADLFGVSS